MPDQIKVSDYPSAATTLILIAESRGWQTDAAIKYTHDKTPYLGVTVWRRAGPVAGTEDDEYTSSISARLTWDYKHVCTPSCESARKCTKPSTFHFRTSYVKTGTSTWVEHKSIKHVQTLIMQKAVRIQRSYV